MVRRTGRNNEMICQVSIRRDAAAADIAGYSRLMGTDEEGTLARLKDVRQALIIAFDDTGLQILMPSKARSAYQCACFSR
jgi:hypothetical protein